jgi:hypothetical protein
MPAFQGHISPPDTPALPSQQNQPNFILIIRYQRLLRNTCLLLISILPTLFVFLMRITQETTIDVLNEEVMKEPVIDFYNDISNSVATTNNLIKVKTVPPIDWCEHDILHYMELKCNTIYRQCISR